MKNIIAAPILTLILTTCVACSSDIPKVVSIDIGDSFQSSVHCQEGYVVFEVEAFQYTENVNDLDLEPETLANEYNYECTYYNNGKAVTINPSLDTETGELKEHLRFVLVEVTVTNVNAITYSGDGTAFCIDNLRLIDTNNKGKSGFSSWSYCWYDGTGEFDAEAMGTSADNYYSVSPGESLTYQLGFIIGSAKDDFSHIYLTDGGGSYYSEDANYVHLDIL